MKTIGECVQGVLKVVGDWKIYPYGVNLIAEGAVAVEGRTIYLHDQALPVFGYRIEN
jgi:hypothetical protein